MPKHRTPLRYPGGKQRLAPFLGEVLEANDALGWNYVEPYAGGAGAAMELLLDGKVGRVYLNDSSLPIYAFWKFRPGTFLISQESGTKLPRSRRRCWRKRHSLQSELEALSMRHFSSLFGVTKLRELKSLRRED